MRIVPNEIIAIWLLLLLSLLTAWCVTGSPTPTAHATEDLLGPIESFTTRRVPAREFLR